MKSKPEAIRSDLQKLIKTGDLLYLTMRNDVSGLPDEIKKEIEKNNVKLPIFKNEYESWYSEALQVIKQFLPDRIEDFIKQYKVEKRKDINFLTYGISDYLLGIQTTETDGLGRTKVIADRKSALPKMEMQTNILKAVERCFESTLFDIKEVLQADIYDSELDSAQDLAQKGFVRGAGAIAGVVLERHLGHVCAMHNLRSRKRHPTISEYDLLLKENNIIDIQKWRFIQHLGDIRNLCDHSGDQEPTQEDVFKLVNGVKEVIKTVF